MTIRRLITYSQNKSTDKSAGYRIGFRYSKLTGIMVASLGVLGGCIQSTQVPLAPAPVTWDWQHPEYGQKKNNPEKFNFDLAECEQVFTAAEVTKDGEIYRGKSALQTLYIEYRIETLNRIKLHDKSMAAANYEGLAATNKHYGSNPPYRVNRSLSSIDLIQRFNEMTHPQYYMEIAGLYTSARECMNEKGWHYN